ncbi:DNA circularization N-terminal domain-containing protein [Paraburkholderia phymatum]|uniref:DNA circularization N-terminal domain-containing protein n=1 Tax=Paraburkholderia phymatum TaxID=148447 RepID=A0ACC6TWU5_9BURK
MTGTTLIAGSRVALHAYPYRRELWVQGLSRGAEHFADRLSVAGRSYGGDVVAQLTTLIAACAGARFTTSG